MLALRKISESNGAAADLDRDDQHEALEEQSRQHREGIADCVTSVTDVRVPFGEKCPP